MSVAQCVRKLWLKDNYKSHRRIQTEINLFGCPNPMLATPNPEFVCMLKKIIPSHIDAAATAEPKLLQVLWCCRKNVSFNYG